MSPIGSTKQISCKFCQKKSAEYMKLYNDYFCPKCLLFQQESNVSEIKTLPIFKLKTYNFHAQKYAYIIYNELESKIGSCELRDLSKFISKKDYNLRFYFFNDINRIVGSMEDKLANYLKNADASWKVYDYSHSLRGEIKHFNNSDTWQILSPTGTIIALRDPKDSKVALQTAKQFTMISAEDNERELFRITRKAMFKLTMLDEEFDTHLAWATVLCIHRSYYL